MGNEAHFSFGPSLNVPATTVRPPILPSFTTLQTRVFALKTSPQRPWVYRIGWQFFQMFGLVTAGLTLTICIIFGIAGLVWRNVWLSMNIVEIPILVSISAIWLSQAIMAHKWIAESLGEDYNHFDYFKCVQLYIITGDC
ncbi:hypothetical protein L218DRAFT_949700 [Marasmius fiardii PR-910]|nr:hypothetical protein L218DRAFT_949700 [Marasmius fiardii PR-910]